MNTNNIIQYPTIPMSLWHIMYLCIYTILYLLTTCMHLIYLYHCSSLSFWPFASFLCPSTPGAELQLWWRRTLAPGDSMVERTSKLWVLRMASLLFANSSGPFRRLGPDWDPMGIMNSIWTVWISCECFGIIDFHSQCSSQCLCGRPGIAFSTTPCPFQPAISFEETFHWQGTARTPAFRTISR